MNRQEKIDQYINGKLKGVDLENFQQEMHTDEMLAKEVQKQQVIASGIEAFGNQKLKAHLQTLRSEMKQPSPKKQSKGTIIRWLMAAAAVAALVFFCWPYFVQAPSSQQLFAQSYEVYNASFSNRDIDGKENLIQAETAYKTKNYAQAITLLEKEIQLNGVNSNLQLALGNAYLASGKAKEAMLHFQSIVKRNDPLFTDQANWYLALSHLKLNQVAQSQTLLHILANNPEADFHQEAIQLLKQY